MHFYRRLTLIAALWATTTIIPTYAAAPNAQADEKANQLLNNRPMSAFNVSQAVPYTVLSRTGDGVKPAMLWVVAPQANTFEKRAQTAMKAAEDYYNETGLSPVRSYLVTLAKSKYYHIMHQGVAIYEPENRRWRAYAYDGPEIPDWKIKVTEKWFDMADAAGGMEKLDEVKTRDEIGRLYNIRPDHVAPLTEQEVAVKPYK